MGRAGGGGADGLSQKDPLWWEDFQIVKILLKNRDFENDCLLFNHGLRFSVLVEQTTNRLRFWP